MHYAFIGRETPHNLWVAVYSRDTMGWLIDSAERARLIEIKASDIPRPREYQHPEPAGFVAAWERLIRAQTSGPIPSYKLQSPAGWYIGSSELDCTLTRAAEPGVFDAPEGFWDSGDNLQGQVSGEDLFRGWVDVLRQARVWGGCQVVGYYDVDMAARYGRWTELSDPNTCFVQLGSAPLMHGLKPDHPRLGQPWFDRPERSGHTAGR